MSKILTLLIVVFLNIAFQINAHAQTSTPLKPIIDWQKRLTAQDRLTAFGDDLMGDQIDPNMGSLVFEHTDISLPGNNGLDVSIRRRLTQGYKYDEGVNVEFGDWELVVPKITAIALAQEGWSGQRCNGSWEQNFPQIQHDGSTLRRHGYMDGVSVTIPSLGSQTLLRNSFSAQFPALQKRRQPVSGILPAQPPQTAKKALLVTPLMAINITSQNSYPAPIRNWVSPELLTNFRA